MNWRWVDRRALLLLHADSLAENGGADGLRDATELAILSANYIAARLADHYPVLYSGGNAAIKMSFNVSAPGQACNQGHVLCAS